MAAMYQGIDASIPRTWYTLDNRPPVGTDMYMFRKADGAIEKGKINANGDITYGSTEDELAKSEEAGVIMPWQTYIDSMSNGLNNVLESLYIPEEQQTGEYKNHVVNEVFKYTASQFPKKKADEYTESVGLPLKFKVSGGRRKSKRRKSRRRKSRRRKTRR